MAEKLSYYFYFIPSRFTLRNLASLAPSSSTSNKGFKSPALLKGSIFLLPFKTSPILLLGLKPSLMSNFTDLISSKFILTSISLNKPFLLIKRKGLFKDIDVNISFDEIKSVKLDISEGFNPRRRIGLVLKGRRKILPLSSAGDLKPLLEVEEEGARLAKFLSVNLEGIK